MRPAALVVLVSSLLSSLGVPACAEPRGSVAPPSLEPGSEARSTAPARDAPETVFVELERRLGHGPLRLRFELVAEGAIVASLAGTLSIAEEVELQAVGRFGGAEHEVRLWTEGDRLRAGARDAPFALDVPRPPELVPALVIGMMRMGLLHNVAMLVGGQPPDHADGGVREWIQTVEHQHVEGTGDPPAIGYGLVVAGQRAAEGTLWIEAHGLPVRRELTVTFGEGPAGQMRVVERYAWLEPLPAG